MPVTLKDIAKKTNLSLGTVSNYINGQRIKEKNRVLIEQAIEELNYTVNQFARGLKTNRSGTIGTITPTLDDPYAAKISSYLTSIFRVNNYAVIICEASSLENEAEVIRFMIQKQVEGVISFPIAEERGAYGLFKEKNIPFICIDKSLKNMECDVFLLNNREIACRATRLAIEKGHRRIGILSGEAGGLSADERLQGYCDALSGAGIALREEYIKRTGYNNSDTAVAKAKELLNCSQRPTAIFATNYFFTLGVVVACNEMQLQLGKDVHLIGFDNIMLNELIRPKLCIVAQPMHEYAEKSSELLLKIIRKEIESPKLVHICEGYITEGDSLGKIENC